ncbi:hypothetical protein ILUMI_11004 [Ignelater luminosus]|uniref:PiggyBac transposable element-derived protein domain-containing protein n=1 Tax=Ignelater luminosus TaxID=2038154 RepID=A0A8K0D111_IGNLU|nr:hypothetical protein ILUMI_11004 [Ignelater luminosus]
MIYTFNMEIYTGKQTEGPFCVSSQPPDVVKKLAAPLFESGRKITADHCFTDFNLIHELKTKKLYVGTVRKNKRQLPFSFVNVKRRAQYSSMFGFNNGMVLASYISRKEKT